MNFMKTICIAALLSLGLALAPPARAQTVLSSTTLSAALSATTSTVSLASATGVTLPGPNATNLKVLVIDREVMLVQTQVGTGAVYGVARGQYGTERVGHLSGAAVFIAPDNALARGALPSGSCTRTNLPYVPIIFIAPIGVNSGFSGGRFDCIGGQFVRTDIPVSVKGSVVTPATSITPTGTYFATDSGATTIATIVVPAGWATGNCLEIQPGGTGATNTSGNIGLTTSSFVVGRIIFFCWDGSKWYPSYVS